MADQTVNVKTGALSSTSMRYHELALQRWLNHLFKVREGYPVPVVFATPMDAFGNFLRLWSADTNPFQYLLQLRDDEGKQIYQQDPPQIRYPLLSVYRKGWKYRSYQNFSIHRFRHINWPTVNKDVSKCDLGNVTVSQMPMAWDYRFQINHFASRPDSQAFFIEKLMWEFHRNGGIPQTWMLVNYPVWGEQLVRVYLDGDIENASPEEPASGEQVEFRTAFNVVVEGFSLDLNFVTHPALWTLLLNSSPASPAALAEAFNPVAEADLRYRDNNVTLDARSNVPADTDCQLEVATAGSLYTNHIYFGDPDLQYQTPQGNPPYWPEQPGYPGGIPSSAAFGSFTISNGTI